MPQISLRQVIYVVIGFAFFFACITLAIKGSQFFQILTAAAIAIVPVFLFQSITFVICKVFANLTSTAQPGPPSDDVASVSSASRSEKKQLLSDNESK